MLDYSVKEISHVEQQVSCFACKSVTKIAQEFLQNTFEKYIVLNFGYLLCDIGIGFTAFPNRDGCHGIIND